MCYQYIILQKLETFLVFLKYKSMYALHKLFMLECLP